MNRTQAEQRRRWKQNEAVYGYIRGDLTFEEAVKAYPYDHRDLFKDWLSDRAVIKRQLNRWEAKTEQAPWWLRWLY